VGLCALSFALVASGCVHAAPTQGEDEVGVASFYSDSLDGRKTASGEVYDRSALTCAHPSLPFGTLLEVTLVETGRTVRVRVNDRGPFTGGRALDLSGEAARRIGLTRRGVGKVRIRVLRLPP
jgi:rare lipoprotein A